MTNLTDLTITSRYHPGTAARFTQDVDQHVTDIALDEGLYRHVKFRKPDSSIYWFDLHTAPGLLTITGDMGTFSFRRLPDMFEFFRSGVDINASYWAEKCQSGDRDYQSYREELFVQHVNEAVNDYCEGNLDVEDPVESAAAAGIRAVVEADVLSEGSHEEPAREAVASFEYKPMPHLRTFRFDDAWEWNLRDYTHRFMWCLFAIRWGIAAYDATKVAVNPRGDAASEHRTPGGAA